MKISRLNQELEKMNEEAHLIEGTVGYNVKAIAGDL
jgi:hypothetical protein